MRLVGAKDDVERFLRNAERNDHAANDQIVRERDTREPNPANPVVEGQTG